MMISLKRNTTPSIAFTISGVSFDDITEVKFAFKLKDNENSDCIFIKEYKKSDAVEHFHDAGDKKILVKVKLTTDETMKIPKGAFYVDVLPIAGSEIIDCGRALQGEMRGTYFNEVIKV